MKKKNSKNSIEKGFEVVNTFKQHAEILQKNEQDKEFVKTLESSVREADKLEKEMLTLKEKLKTKKLLFERQKELTLEYVRTAKKILKKELGNKQKPLNKQKEQKLPKTEKVEETI
jgi:uncharacterized protein YwqG